ncbi:MAG: hypothetical protein K0R65_2402 [Crocinitomicaceae bacterium]|jgi:benzil reductase ((S)-benzoin forming)|nr:hypothetical protein [Crocinitomicaceae bacterium]
MQVFITGVSRGLGLALVQEYLSEGFRVTGIGRSNTIQAENYSFLPCDLSDYDQVEALKIEIGTDPEVLLINNAGVLSPVQRVSDQEQDYSKGIFQVNTIAPIQLMRKFLRECEKEGSELTILNISSGAGRRAIPSWANYCASKAALDLFSETLQFEEREKGKRTRVYSLAPGVINTGMQETIRESKPADFSSLETFQQLFENDELQSAEETARKIRLSLWQNGFDKVITRFT